MVLFRSIIYILIANIACIACQSIDTVAAPKTIIPEDQMVSILTDIAFVRAAKVSQKNLLEEKKFNPELYVLSLHTIDSIVFAENNAWYSRDIERYQTIFSKVKENLENCKIEYEALHKKEKELKKKKNDSLKKIKSGLEKK